MKLPLSRIPSWFTYLLLVLLGILPLLETIGRTFFHNGIPASADYVRHIVLWLAFLGGVITTKDGRHVAFTAGYDLLPEKGKRIASSASAFLTVGVATAMSLASLAFAFQVVDAADRTGLFPTRWLLLIMPVCFAVMAGFFVARAPSGWGRLPAWLGLAGGLAASAGPVSEFLGLFWPSAASALVPLQSFIAATAASLALPCVILLIASALFGTPIFIVLGGLALFLFTKSGGMLAVVPNEAYTILTRPAIPAIPLFTLAGFVLAAGKGGERLVTLFKAALGWMPGGMAMAAVLLCAFFTTFTGASGVTILALGGLLSFVLINNGYSRPFSLGLLTSSGSIGLLFPPSLPVIMFGVMAQINIMHMFIAGLLPGLVMMAALMLMGLRHSLAVKSPREPFVLLKLFAALKDAAWEILLPVIVFAGYFSGLFTLVETGAVAAVYALVTQVLVRRDIAFKDLPAVLRKCLVLVGGILVILASAKGLSYYIVDSQVPTRLVEWTQTFIHSKYLFLLLLNLALLVAGCLMDIFSAIIVVVPLILPLGAAFGINPVHLGIIFLANMELGYLTPTIGLNLFIGSYTFNEPLARMSKYVIPFMLVLFLTVMLITYVPGLATILLPGGR